MIGTLCTLEAILPAVAKAAEISGNKSHWGYIGAEAPERWGKLSTEYRVCSVGVGQSPINLSDPVKAELGELEISYQDSPLKILHNGHTVQINYAPGSTISFDNQEFELLQFHFHDPSEHTLNQRKFAMEMHLVHKNNQTGNLAVLGVFIKKGTENQALKSIWQNMPQQEMPEATIAEVSINALQLLPSEITHFYRYHGSLTTPPCSEVVDWVVLAQPIEASAQQIDQFIATVGVDARPVQPLGKRVLRLS